MTFARPQFLLIGGILFIAVVVIYRALERRRSQDAYTYSNLPFLLAATGADSLPSRLYTAGWMCAVILALLAICGPSVHALVPKSGGSVVLCVDTSGSMAANDVAPTRAQAALAAMQAFIAQAPEQTAIGIISFSSDAQVLTQPTRDRDEIASALGAVPAPNGATAIGDALALARRILPPTGARAVVLITDGENNAGSDPMVAARALGAAHVPIYTVGIGTNSGALIPGTLQTAGIDEQALQAYAQLSGGAYSRADDAGALRSVLARLGRTTTFVRANLDISLGTALAGAGLMLFTFLAGMAAGRYP